jgi:hypothetical protein
MVDLRQPKVKSLGKTIGVMCEAGECENPAAYLFRINDSRISAYCADHAAKAAFRLGIKLKD